jgi:hypothetical protein
MRIKKKFTLFFDDHKDMEFFEDLMIKWGCLEP